MVLYNLFCIVRLLLTCSWRNRKQAVGISSLIIRPSHLVKKLLPAAVERSQTLSALLIFNRAAAALQQRNIYTLDLCPFSSVPSSHHSTAQQWRLCVVLSEQTSEAGLQQITVAGLNHRALFLSTLLTRLGSLAQSSELPASLDCLKTCRACLCNRKAQKDHHYYCNRSRGLYYCNFWKLHSRPHSTDLRKQSF